MPLGFSALPILLDLVAAAPRVKEWVKQKRLPTEKELEPLAKTVASLEDRFKKSLEDELLLTELVRRLYEDGETVRGDLVFKFTNDKGISGADREFFRKIIFTAKELKNEDAAYAELCYILDTPTKEGILEKLDNYRTSHPTPLTPAELLREAKARWEKSDKDGYLRHTRVLHRAFKIDCIRDDKKVTDDDIKKAKEKTKDGWTKLIGSFK